MNKPNRYIPVYVLMILILSLPTYIVFAQSSDIIYEEGQRSDEITQLKENLNKLGFSVTMNYPNRYGPATTKAVKEFQKYHDLNITGNVDESTLSTLNNSLSTALIEGQRSKAVTKLKENLNLLGFQVTMDYPNRYGPATTAAVKEFQDYYNLATTGVADKIILEKIDELLSENEIDILEEGMRHPRVIVLKENLNLLGFSVTMDYPNRYGPATTKAVKAFQKYYNIEETGKVGEVTATKIDDVLANAYFEGQRDEQITKLKENLNLLGFSVTMNYPNRYGPATTKAVKEFQQYYGMLVSGTADLDTRNTLEDIIKNAFMRGQRADEIIQLKENLNLLGFEVGMNYPNSFGKETENAVKRFQKKYKLKVTGIADKKTLAKINSLVDQIGEHIKTEYTNYNLTLNEAVNIQDARPTVITDLYRNKPAYVSAKYFDRIGSGKISATTVNVRTEPNTSSNIPFQLKRGDGVNIIGTINGQTVSGSTVWYKIAYGSNEYYVHSSLVTGSKYIATDNVNVRAGKGTNHHIYGLIEKGTSVEVINPGSSWHEIKYDTWRRPTKEDLREYMDPSKHNKLQHLRLDSSVGVPARELNKILAGKGVLNGKGQAFIDAGKKHNMNEVYLISHAFLESGNGTSTLAKGVEVGLNSKGNPVRVTSSNRNSLTKIKKAYNMFGIGAVDSDPLNGGSQTAYENGWFSVEEAIVGGAEWIRRQYAHNEHKQNTLYKMKWNPNMDKGAAWKQYATDIGWAVKQTRTIENLYKELKDPHYHYDIARYK